MLYNNLKFQYFLIKQLNQCYMEDMEVIKGDIMEIMEAISYKINESGKKTKYQMLLIF